MAPIYQAESGRLSQARSAYARQVCATAGITPGSGIEAALAAIPREQFVGPPPWQLVSNRGRIRTASSDPAVLYQDILVSLGGEPGLNNGQPSLHALCLAALNIRPGDCAIHVGAGTGYYTAMLAALVGKTGCVDAYEIEPGLAARAGANLAQLHRVEMHSRSGAIAPLPACDILYVNAAAAEPLSIWLDALRPGGRVLFPLAGNSGAGELFRPLPLPSPVRPLHRRARPTSQPRHRGSLPQRTLQQGHATSSQPHSRPKLLVGRQRLVAGMKQREQG